MSKILFLSAAFFSCIAFADETLKLRGTLAIGNCQEGRSPKCVLHNADRIPFELVLKPHDEYLSGIRVFNASAGGHSFNAIIRVTKYKDFREEYHYNFDIFVDHKITENGEDTVERNYLGYFDIKDMNSFSDIGLWGQRRGQDNDWYAPHVIIGADPERNANR